ncbi:MAG TPA: hypothetical protein PKW90_20325, partial [Myxococcota bacterium]|nr:hypothetical protein [Myxococcota bacterium]
RTVNHQEYHCLVRYKLAGRWFYDDPSARLGMYGRVFQSPETVERLLLQQAGEIDKLTVLTPAWHKFMKIGG